MHCSASTPRQVHLLDLPGHCDSDSAPTYDIESVVGMVHAAVGEAGLVETIMVGHLSPAIVATVYATRHRVRPEPTHKGG
jgi:pimeloyl-ACP methyl ester carboxylesterase